MQFYNIFIRLIHTTCDVILHMKRLPDWPTYDYLVPIRDEDNARPATSTFLTALV